MGQYRTAHILIVDDQVKWRNALQMILEQEGYTVMTASDFESACNLLDSWDFDLVTLDVRLVDDRAYNVQGLGLLQRIKRFRPETKVIILTGYPENIHEGFLEEHKADALLLKVPEGARFDKIVFQQLVRTLLSS
jgi:DNA-binding NtrC family response regulator